MLEGSNEGEINALAISKDGDIFVSGKLFPTLILPNSNFFQEDRTSR